MAHRIIDEIRPDFSIPSLAQGTAAIAATFLVAVGLISFFVDSDVFAEIFGLPDRPIPTTSDKPSKKDPLADAINPWIYALGARVLVIGFLGLELARRTEWQNLGFLFISLGAIAAIDAWTTRQYGNQTISFYHAAGAILFAALGGVLVYV